MSGHERNSSGPSTSSTHGSPSTSTSHWHKIRPWSPHFILTIREITSVSATFILSSTLSSKDSEDAEGLVSGNVSDDDLEDAAANTGVHVVSDALAKGLSVNVNGAPWKRSYIRMADEGDEAIIILHGLMPGRQYDIELGIDSGERGEETVHTHMVTQCKAPEEIPAEVDANGSDYVSSPQISTPNADAPSIDEYATQLRAQINQLTAEHALLAAQLKTTRRDSQKADAALRSEIEAIRRACEKGAVGEQRARQKTLALQEAVKQAHAAASETEAAVTQTESEMPALREEEKTAERIHAETKRDLDRAEEEKDEALRADKKRVADLKAELAALDSRVEKLTTKRDKLRKETLPSMEREVERVGREVELVERDADGFEVVDRGPVMFGVDLSPQGRGFLGAIGSQRNVSGYVPKPLFPTLASTATTHATVGSRPSPLPTSFATSSTSPHGYTQAMQKTQEGVDMGAKVPNSTLSSLAPPFDPTVGYTNRLSTPPSVSSTSTSFDAVGNIRSIDNYSRTPPFTPSPHSESHTHATSHVPLRSANMPPPGLVQRTPSSVFGSYPHQSIQAQSHNHAQSWDVGAGAQVDSSVMRRPSSPVRQTSLPSHMPQFIGQTGRSGR